MVVYSSDLVNVLSDGCCDNIEECLVALGVDFTKSGDNRVFGRCPIHEGSNNPSGWSLYPNGDEVRGFWRCHTHHCENKFKKNFSGFVHGVLTQQAGHPIHWSVAVEWMLKFLGYKHVSDVKIPDKGSLARRAQMNALHRWNIVPKTKIVEGWDRKRVRSTLEIPSNYFLSRGFKSETLDKYDVGLYAKQNRVLVPVYDPSYKNAVGFMGRSIYDKCDKCNCYHEPSAQCPPSAIACSNSSKWRNSVGFESASHLYNYWFARKSIMESATILLVEGPGDVWRLEEAGVTNSVGLFGCNLSDEQISLIESSWCMNVIVLLDNDESGILGAQEIKRKLGRTHRLYFPSFTGKDIGGLKTDDIDASVMPYMDKIREFQQTMGVKL